MTSSSRSTALHATATGNFLLASMPFLFVLIWSTGFIVAKFGLP